MRKKLSSLLFGLGLAVAVFMTAERVQATLGEAEDSVAFDAKILTANRVTRTAYNGYTVEQIDSDSVIVREYISPTGVVFAIAWNGLVHPNLAPLLGRHADEHEKSLRHASRKPGRRSLRVETARIVVEKWGHMRNLQGRAYIPALIPDGVAVDEIR